VIGWMARRLHRGERGSSAAFVAVLAVPLLLLFGLVLDGGRALEAKLRAKDVAAEAARAGANNCDPLALRGVDPDTGAFIESDCKISLITQADACADAAASVLANAPAGATMTVCDIGDNGHVVTVGVEFQIHTTFLGLVAPDLTVRATQSARVYTSQ
jgi:putative Flp pilus-assembly TadE/G-like protein